MRTTRQQKYWGLVSGRAYSFGERLGAPYRHLVQDILKLRPGETVLDLGCGTGQDFQVVADAVGPTGRIVAVDFSPKMLARAQARIDEHGWANIELWQGDACADPLGVEEFDAAVADCSLSAMTDIEAAVGNLYQAIKPGGRVLVMDWQPSGVLRGAYRLLAGAKDIEVASRVKDRFDRVDMLDAKGEPVPWRAKTPWYVMVSARKAA